jgi:catecholate siderophore receptor
VAFGLNTPTKIFVDYLHVEQDNTPDGGVFTVGLPGYSSPDPTNRPFMNTAPRVSSSNYYGTTSDHDNVRADMFTVIVDHAFTPDLSIRNTTRVGRTRQDYMLSSFMGGTTQLVTPNPADPSTWTILRNINNKLANNEIVANQTNLKARFKTGPLSHSVSTGL